MKTVGDKDNEFILSHALVVAQDIVRVEFCNFLFVFFAAYVRMSDFFLSYLTLSLYIILNNPDTIYY